MNPAFGNGDREASSTSRNADLDQLATAGCLPSAARRRRRVGWFAGCVAHAFLACCACSGASRSSPRRTWISLALMSRYDTEPYRPAW